MAALVDTAALAVDLHCTPARVRYLVRERVITPCGKKVVSRLGRPSLMFDLDAVHDEIDSAVESGRVELVQGAVRVRKST
jgi:hypothetical protein